jgi:hypothetical protein
MPLAPKMLSSMAPLQDGKRAAGKPDRRQPLVALLISTFSVSGAIFLILELDQPFAGVIQISSAPMRDAFTHLGE